MLEITLTKDTDSLRSENIAFCILYLYGFSVCDHNDYPSNRLCLDRDKHLVTTDSIGEWFT